MTETPTSPGAAGPSRRRQIYKDLALLSLVALVLLTDQLSKSLVREFLALRESFPAEGFFRISHTYNTGSAFGLFQGQNSPLILASLVGVTVLVLIYYSQPRPSLLLRLSLGLQLGGAAGNLLDRALLGHVTDFMDVGAWPVFNVADASIVTGLVVLGWLFITGSSQKDGQEGPAVALETDGRLDLAALDSRYSRCPVCDGHMRPAGLGWRCSTCGVRERIEDSLESRESQV